ncbi:MAG: hypothetical protein JXA54_03820 [Candidatus Heimdallarchaeota archaeon]|nr:hypothetical protein [Candidatus Heimdallarchaeota archaeon]
MTEKELLKYDKQVRSEVLNRSQRPCDGETVLMAFINKYQQEFPVLAKYPYLLEFEYDVIPGRTDIGHGDLIFADGKNAFLIVETKYLTESSGKTACATRNRQRGKMEEQSSKYCYYFKITYPKADANYLIITSKSFPSYDLYNKYLKFKENLKIKWLVRDNILYPTNKE